MKQLSRWVHYIAPLLMISTVGLATAADNGESIPSSPIVSGAPTLTVAAPAGMATGTISTELLTEVRKQIDVKRFPYLDHRPQETAEKLAAILFAAAVEADAMAKQPAANPPVTTVALRNKVLAQIDAFLKESTGRESDWKWVIVSGRNIEKTWQNKTKDAQGGPVPDARKPNELAYIYLEFATAASSLADDFKRQKEVENDLLVKAMVNGGFTMSNSNSGWVTIPEPRRRTRCACRWLAP